ncbi:sulfurtransferase TusA family protein [Streptomyces sp. SID5789]|uniref:sulfurtransferase TusA family protein n=1 Tax=Streptomyces sp. SID5789 TaxID=2690310 RepID=UPI001F35684A|nr:sulfurtransferase TusA family protein [Streptomyces sp. SID5789]
MTRTPPSAEPVLTVDGTGLRCVTLLLRLRDQIADVPPGTVVHVIATDPAAPLDLPAWCHMTGHTYLGPAPANGRCTPGSAPPTPSSPARTLPGTRSGAGDASRRPAVPGTSHTRNVTASGSRGR